MMIDSNSPPVTHDQMMAKGEFLYTVSEAIHKARSEGRMMLLIPTIDISKEVATDLLLSCPAVESLKLSAYSWAVVVLLKKLDSD